MSITNAAGQNISATVVWTSSDTTVATVNASGMVVARAPGNTVLSITATVSGLSTSASRAQTVVADAVTTINISAPDSIEQANGFLVSATALGKKGRVLSAPLVFGTSDGSILTLGPDNTVVGRAGGRGQHYGVEWRSHCQ